VDTYPKTVLCHVVGLWDRWQWYWPGEQQKQVQYYWQWQRWRWMLTHQTSQLQQQRPQVSHMRSY